MSENPETTDEGAPKGAEKQTGTLDLAVEMDEPELLIAEVRKAAGRLIGRSPRGEMWRQVAETAGELEARLAELNAAPSR